MANKALIIEVGDIIKSTGILNSWEKIQDTGAFADNIKTPDIADGVNKAALVTGMPTIFARADMFKHALDTVSAMANNNSSLMAYYEDLKDEWKGLIACLALDTTVEVKRIYLKYSDGQDLSHTSSNIYEARGSFGNMLFNRRALWSEIDQTTGKVVSSPFIDVIKYKKQVVGGTSPESLLFTSPGYTVTDDRFSKNGRFCDPLKVDRPMDEENMRTLYAYVKNLVETLSPKDGTQSILDTYYSKLDDEDIRPNYVNLRTLLTRWMKDIHSRIVENVESSQPNPVQGFGVPFNKVFNISGELFYINGNLSSFEKNGYKSCRPDALLLPKESEIACITPHKQPTEAQRGKDPVKSGYLESLPVYLMPARVADSGTEEWAYFALPLSDMGYEVFGNNIGALLNLSHNHNIRSEIHAEFYQQQRENNLHVTLFINTDDDKKQQLKRIYSVKKHPIERPDILIWPNFISSQWRRYYMYSELPCDSDVVSDFHATPFVGRSENGVFTPVCRDGKPVLLDSPKNVLEEAHLNERLTHQLIRANSMIGDFPYKYDIFQSELPYAGIKLTSGTKESGLLILHYSQGENNDLPKNLMRENENQFTKGTVSLGVDYGSTNTSISFVGEDDGNHVRSINFQNRRISLFGWDSFANRPIHPRDILFFYAPKPGQEIQSNAIKSMLTVHNSRRLQRTSSMTDISQEQISKGAVSGGMPCMLRDLPIVGIKDDHIRLEFSNIGESTEIISNMKWQDSDIDINYTSAFLRTLMYYVYAELFIEHYKPVKLNWSYPLCMDTTKVQFKYSNTWRDMHDEEFTPITFDGQPVLLEVTTKQSGGEMPTNIGLFGNSSSSPFGGPSEMSQTPASSFSDSSSSFGNGTTSPFGSGSSPFGGGFGTSASEGAANGFGSIGNVVQSTPLENQNRPLTIQERIALAKKQQQMSTQVLEESNTLDDILSSKNHDENLSFVNIATDKPMTEAQAVANYVSNNADFRSNKNVVLSFDIGGSTSDISAIFVFRGKNTMLKQSSIRFAAQRVAQATSIFYVDFKRALEKITQKYNIKLIGFNDGTNRYSAETASYYYEQIVDRLNGEQLKEFYRAIAAECPRLFAVDMYVTGLIMFYAGQLAGKLYEVLRNHASEIPTFNELKFQPVFQGKGGRIFDWLIEVEPAKAIAYYQMMFVRGLGYPQDQVDIVANIMLDFTHLFGKSADNVKMEVSGGLAITGSSLQVPPVDSSLEIFGEENFIGYGKNNQYKYKYTDDLTYQRMKLIGNEISQSPEECPCFQTFAELYYQSISWIMGVKLDGNEFVNGVKNMNISMYISRECPDFIKARNNSKDGKFEFLAPIIILEGIKFYEKNLLK